MLLRCESLEPPMSQLGQPLPSQDFCGTAALPLKSDIARRGCHGRKVPGGDIPPSFRQVYSACLICRCRFVALNALNAAPGQAGRALMCT